jgi:Transcriptional Coactivator p15 (PC4)
VKVSETKKAKMATLDDREEEVEEEEEEWKEEHEDDHSDIINEDEDGDYINDNGDHNFMKLKPVKNEVRDDYDGIVDEDYNDFNEPKIKVKKEMHDNKDDKYDYINDNEDGDCSNDCTAPKSKFSKIKKQEEANGNVGEDEGDSDDKSDKPQRKKAKIVKKTKNGQKRNANGDAYFELSSKRRIVVRKFKGNILIDIREVSVSH